MSLVRDALAKAEREAAARAARERGLPERLAVQSQPYRAPRRRSWLPFLLGAALAVAVTTAGLLILSDGQRAPAPAGPEAPSRSAVAGEVSARETVPPAAPVGAPSEPTRDGDSASQSKPPASPPPPLGAAPRPLSPPEPGPAAPPARPAVEVFIGELVLDDGATRVELGGIAWSEAAPLAYLNGRLLATGESVAGLRIERIERHRVELSGGGRRLILNLR